MAVCGMLQAMSGRLLRCLLLALALSSTTSLTADAQEMSQGEAHITARSDVRLSFESMPGTGGARLSALGRAVGAGMPGLRACYAEVVAQRPTVQGTMRLRTSLGARGPLDVTIESDGPGDSALLGCVRRVLRTGDVSGVERPAAAIAVLQFENSAAHGAAETARRTEQADDVPVAESEGQWVSRSEAPGVRFEVRARSSIGRETVAEGLRVVRAQIAGLLDCRRRASRRGMNPGGSIEFEMRMNPGRAPELTAGTSTVADERAPSCLERALERTPRKPAERGSVNVRVEFDAGS